MLEKKEEFLSDVDWLLDVFCNDHEQRRSLDKEHKLRMTDEDYAFYEDQNGQRIEKCLDVALPLTTSNMKLIPRSESKLNATCSFMYQSEIITLQFALDYASETKSLASTNTDSSDTSATSEFVAETSNSFQNRKKSPNHARICKRCQLSHTAANAVANSV